MKRKLKTSTLIIRFIEGWLKQPSGKNSGEPLKLDPWQKKIIREVYDPKRNDGFRIVETALLTVGRKNGKTALVAALVLCHLIGPLSFDRFGQQVYSAAADREQAALVFREAMNMILLSEVLSNKIQILESKKRLVVKATQSFYQALSADAYRLHGLNPTVVICDEMGNWPGKGRELYNVLTTAFGAQEEHLTWIISTQSADDTSLMSEMVDYAVAVNNGDIVDPTFRGFVYTVPEDVDPFDEKHWIKANPALKSFRSLRDLRNFSEKAKALPANQAYFQQLFLNQRVDAADTFLTPEIWKACGGEPIIPDVLRGRDCFAGLDLSGKNDLTALVLVFPDDDFENIDVVCHFWTPREGIREKEKRDRVPYMTWHEQGYLHVVPGVTIDYRYIAKELGAIISDYNLINLGFDRWRIDDLTRELDDIGLEVPMTAVGQGFVSMNPIVEIMEDMVFKEALNHGDHPVLTWCISNTTIQTDPAGGRKFDKMKSRGRIDGTLALGMALRCLVTAKDEYSCYEEEDMLVL